MNPLSLFLAWRQRKRAERMLKTAEHQRAALIAQIEDGKKHKREWRPKVGLLKQATEASLRASVGRP